MSNSCINDESLGIFSKFSNSKVDNAHVSIYTIDLSHNDLSSDSACAMISLISLFKLKNTIVSDSVAKVETFKVSLLSNVSKVVKTAIFSTGEGSHFLMNYKVVDMNINFLNQLGYKRQLYVWNSNVPLSVIPNLTVKCDTINVYEENLSDQKISDIASKLIMISEERDSNITYVLQSTNKIMACGADFYQIFQSFKSISFSKDRSSWKMIDMRQCNVGEKVLLNFLNYLIITIQYL